MEYFLLALLFYKPDHSLSCGYNKNAKCRHETFLLFYYLNKDTRSVYSPVSYLGIVFDCILYVKYCIHTSDYLTST